ncbi:MAG: tryptophan 7-halogenase [Planctomycetes bacterium]|nr:tryptophan 7-halogenase [Planctomycetota bacterium]
MQPQPDVDVVVLGGGLASLCLGRLAQRELPEVKVLCLDKATEPKRKVGESTVEVAGHFLHTRLGLGDVLVHTQLPKHGIRYWFNDEGNQLDFCEASEDGPASTSWWHTFQLERDQLERDLLRLNREQGIAHLTGARVTEVLPATDGGLHRVRYTHDGADHEVSARWLVDGSGPGSLLGRQVGLLTRDDRLPHGSCWGWFKGGRSPQELLDEQTAKRRFCFGKRLLSTNSFMGEGYWVWCIPQASGLLSVGLVYDKSVVPTPPSNEAEFKAFLAEHRMLSQLLEGAELVEFGRLDNYARKPRTYLRQDRLAWIGMAAGFVDPLYSSGLDFIAFQCEYLVDLWRRERAGEGLEPARLQAYNGFLEGYYEQAVRYFSGLYRTFASAELALPRYRRDVHIYWSMYTWPFFSRQFLDPEFLAGHAALAERIRARTAFFSRVFSQVYDDLKARGAHLRRNRGRYTFNQLGWRMIPFIRFERQMGHAVTPERLRALADEIDAVTLLFLLDVRFDGDRCALRGLLFDALKGAPLDELVAAESQLGVTEAWWAQVLGRLEREVNARLELDEPVVIDAASLGQLRRALRDLADEPQRKRALEAYLAPPAMDDLDDLPPLEQTALQEPMDWGGVPHARWNLPDVSGQTIYGFLGDRWWNRPVHELPQTVWGLRG